MVNLISRGENKRQTGVRLLVGEKVGLTKLVERGTWSENLHAHPSSGQEDQRVFGIARSLDVRRRVRERRHRRPSAPVWPKGCANGAGKQVIHKLEDLSP